MKASEVVAALHGRWPDDKYMKILEAPEGASRQGRKIDMLAVSLWRSRGYQVDAVEVKVSVSDARREFKEPEKADFWWRHSDRFWIAAPADVAGKIRDDVPAGWGLLAVNESSTRVVDAAVKHDREPLSWPSMIGVLRASVDCGVAIQNRKYQQGYDAGLEAGERRASGSGRADRLQGDLDRLRERLAVFEERSGVKIDSWQPPERLGEAVDLILKCYRSDHDANELLRIADRFRAHADNLADVVGALKWEAAS